VQPFDVRLEIAHGNEIAYPTQRIHQSPVQRYRLRTVLNPMYRRQTVACSQWIVFILVGRTATDNMFVIISQDAIEKAHFARMTDQLVN
jgi:hypothetical protein